MWAIAAYRWTPSPCRLAWFEGRQLSGAQSAFINESGELWQWLCHSHCTLNIGIGNLVLLGRIAVLRSYVQPIVVDGVAWSVGLSVGLSQSLALQKWVNRSRCRLVCGLGWAKESMCLTVHVRRRCGLSVKLLRPLFIILAEVNQEKFVS